MAKERNKRPISFQGYGDGSMAPGVLGIGTTAYVSAHNQVEKLEALSSYCILIDSTCLPVSRFSPMQEHTALTRGTSANCKGGGAS